MGRHLTENHNKVKKERRGMCIKSHNHSNSQQFSSIESIHFFFKNRAQIYNTHYFSTQKNRGFQIIPAIENYSYLFQDHSIFSPKLQNHFQIRVRVDEIWIRVLDEGHFIRQLVKWMEMGGNFPTKSKNLGFHLASLQIEGFFCVKGLDFFVKGLGFIRFLSVLQQRAKV